MEIDNENETPTTAVSLYGDSSDAMDDFPILKAFQEYVDKEQAKARHRMTAMTILFMFILFMVVGGLSFVIYNLNLRNQALNDRLIDFAMKEREVPAQQVIQPQPAPQPVVVQPPQDNSVLVAMVESLKTLIQEQKAASVQNVSAPQPAPALQEPQGPSPEQLAMEKKLKEQQERIEKTAALLKAQEEAIAAQKAQLREQELEAYRRKHYPEYYQRIEQQQIQKQVEAEQPHAAPRPQSKTVKPVKRPKILEVVEDIEVDDDEIEDMLDTDDNDIEDIESEDEEFEDYYNEDDEDYSIPVDSGANWLIPKD